MKGPCSLQRIVLGCLFASVVCSAAAQTTAPNDWTWVGGSDTGDAPTVYGTLGIPAPGNVPGARDHAASWTDKNGNLWLFGGSTPGAPLISTNDFWKFSPSTNLWTWMGGGGTFSCNALVCGQSGVYGTLGVPAPENFPGARSNAASWTDSSGNLWLFGGYGFGVSDTFGALNEFGRGFLNDLWEYFPDKNEWAWMGGSETIACKLASMSPPICGEAGVYGDLGVPAKENAPGARANAILWTDGSGNVWLFGGEGVETISTPGNNLAFNDVWVFNPTTLQWTWIAGSNTPAQSYVRGVNGPSSISISPVYGTLGMPAPGNTPGAVADPNGKLFDGAYWTDSKGNLWLLASGTNALWEFYPALKQWAWMGGGNTINNAGVYGTKGQPADANIPGPRSDAAHWSDSNGNFWLFGGNGYDAAGTLGNLSDLWELNPSTNQWVWIGGSKSANQSGQYGTLGSPDSRNIPGARYGASSWSDLAGNLWLFGGASMFSGGSADSNDLWEYQPSVITWPSATPSFSPAAGTYTSAQTVTISDWTPGSTIYFTTDGTTPTTSSAVYQSPIFVSSTQTIQAIATAPGFAVSRVSSASYTLLNPTPTPTFSVPGGTFTSAQTVSISDVIAGALIYYTTDGSIPTTASTLYTGPISVAVTEVLQAIAIAPPYGISAVARAQFTINLPSWEIVQWAWMGPARSSDAGVYGTLRTPAATNTPGSRAGSLSWTDSSGNFWLFGGFGYDSTGAKGYLNDLWEYDPTALQWTWMGGKNTIGSENCNANGWCSQPAVYGTLGVAAPDNIPGGTPNGVSWVDSGGHFWFFANGNEVWEYFPSTNQWAWMGGGSTTNQSGVFGTQGTPAPGNIPAASSGGTGWTDQSGNFWLFEGANNQLWKLRPSTNEWAYMGSGPGGRSWAASWTDNQGNLWLFGGGTNDIFQDVNELWEYVPSSNQWTLRGGGGTTNQFGVYGILGTPSTANIPGATTSVYSWTDNNGNVWLYGGVFLQPQCMNSTCDPPDVAVDNVNDLWLFSPSTSEWTWMAGVKMADCAIQCTPPPVYGTLGTPAAQNTPGGRYGGTTWKDRSGRLLLFGGSSAGHYNYLNNDLWVFQPVPNRLLTETPTFNVPAGTYSSTQYVAVSDATPGAKIYFTTDGTTPTSNSTVYSGPVTVNTSLTLQAIATATGYGDSRVASAAYTIDRTLPDFSVGSSPASLSLTNGQSGTVTISVKPQGSFASAVSFTCSGLPAGAACSFSPATVTPSGASASTMLTVTTSRTTAFLRRIDPMLFPESLLAALFCCFGWTKRNSFRSFLVLATSLIGLALLNGCGGQSTHQQQPVTSTITVTAASGSIRHATTISLTLN